MMRMRTANQDVSGHVGWITLTLLSIILSMPGESQTQPPSIMIGGNTISIGMPAAPVLMDLRIFFKLERAEDLPFHKDAISWAVLPKGDGPIFAYVNVIDNKIVGVEYLLLGKTLKSAQDLFDPITEVSSKLEQEHRNSCVVRPTIRYVPAGQLKDGVLLWCGEYLVSLRRARIGDDSVDYYEVWEALGTTS